MRYYETESIVEASSSSCHTSSPHSAMALPQKTVHSGTHEKVKANAQHDTAAWPKQRLIPAFHKCWPIQLEAMLQQYWFATRPP